MKQEFVLIVALLAACASGGPAITTPNVIFEQENGPGYVNYPNGPIEVKFDMQIERTMRTGEPVSIRAVVYFDTPAGTYQKVVAQQLPQEAAW